MREYAFGKLENLGVGLPQHLVDVLSRVSPSINYVKGMRIFRQGEEADMLYFLQRGRVKSTLCSYTGQETIIRIHLPHSILGLTAFASNPLRDADGTALDSVIATPISKTVFVELMLAEPELSPFIVRLLADRMSDFHFRVGEWLHQPVIQRLIRALIVLSTPNLGADSEYLNRVPLTHEELANLTNARRPTVSKILSSFSKLGVIQQKEGELKIINRAHLIHLAEYYLKQKSEL